MNRELESELQAEMNALCGKTISKVLVEQGNVVVYCSDNTKFGLSPNISIGKMYISLTELEPGIEPPVGSKYSVIQFHPEAIIGECINIGCVAFDFDKDGPIYHRFLKDWSRVQAFGGRYCQFLLDFAKDFDNPDRPITRKQIEKFLRVEYPLCIRFTPLRGSILSAEKLIEFTAKHFLVEPDEQKARLDQKPPA